MKKNWRNKTIAAATIVAVGLSACQQEKPATETANHEQEVLMTENLDFLVRPTNQAVVARMTTIKPERTTKQDTIMLSGVITYNPDNVFSVPARVAGRIEKLYVKYNFQPVSKGQKLLEIYSPELVTAQKELLFLLNADPDNQTLINGAKQKLRFLGASEGQINQLVRTRRESYTFVIYSPYNGYALTPGAAVQASAPAAAAPSGGAGMADGMGSGSTAPTPQTANTQPATSQEFGLREGMYVTAGQALVQVVNNEQLWAEFNVPANQVNAFKKGMPVTIDFVQQPGRTITSKIDLVQPYFNQGQNFATVRVTIPARQNQALIGQLVNATTTYTTQQQLWLPQDAIVTIGSKAVVFRKAGGVFEPIAVTIGQQAGSYVAIVSDNLTEKNEVAANAQFLVDSESFINVAR